MTISLDVGTTPHGLIAKAVDGVMLIGDYLISDHDFCHLMMEFLTNTNLKPDDPRPNILDEIRKLKVVPGYQNVDKTGIRLGIPDSKQRLSEADSTYAAIAYANRLNW